MELLESKAYQVDVRDDYVAGAEAADETQYDLVLLSLMARAPSTIAYALRLQENSPNLPLLILPDAGVVVPIGMRSHDDLEPGKLLTEIEGLISGETHTRAGSRPEKT